MHGVKNLVFVIEF